LPLFTSLLSLPLPMELPPLQLTPELQRRRTLEAMCAWLFALADQHPLVLAAEDLHWTDPSTIEFLGMLIEHGQWYPMLVLATHRPEFVPPWASSHLMVLPLHPLSRKEIDELILNVAGGKRVPVSVREHVFEKGDGVPLFVEELTKSVLESDLLQESDESWERTDPLPGLSVPSTLQDSLESRLDRLGPAKELLQLAAVLGREFFHAELRAVAVVEDGALETLLEDLIAAGLVYRRGMPPRATYAFKHALIQDTAYRSLLPETRQGYHAQIAEAFEECFPERLDTEPEGIARHYEEAGLTTRAIEAYERAGARAASRSANDEAIAHFRKALTLLGATPAGAERDQKEIALQVALGGPLAASRGFGSAEVQEAYERARVLSQGLGEHPQLAEALGGLVTFYITQSKLEDASELADQQLRLADRLNEPARLLGAHYRLALIRYFEGDPRRSLHHFEAFDKLYDPELHRELASTAGENVGVASAIWCAWTLWIRGYPDRALEACREALSRANDVAHLFSVAYAHAWTSIVRWHRGDLAETIEHSEAAIAIAEEYCFPIPLGVARLERLRCLPDGPLDDAVLKQGEAVLLELAATGTLAGTPQILGGFGELCLERGRPERAATYVEGGLGVSRNTGQPHWDAELYRAKGALLLAQQPAAVEEVEALLRRAVELAASQHAHSLELRAAIDLSRLLRDQGRDSEAHDQLGEIYAWFTEGFDTKDLIAARTLLDELA
jgi:tetratricopeptide (TPR) repeat protein